jgi:hypothetical protein
MFLRRSFRCRAVALIAGFLGLVSGVEGGVDLSQFEWRQDMGVTESGLVKVSLPTETIGHARAGLADLRVVDPAGDEVPYWLEHPAPPRLERSEAVGLDVFVEEGVTRVLVRRAPGGEVRRIVLDIPSPDYFKAVTVLDGSGRVLVENQPIFRQRGGVERSVIDLGATGAEEFTLIIRDDRTGPVVVRGVYFDELSGARVDEEVMAVEVVEAMEGLGESYWILRLGAAGVRLGQLSVEVDDRLFDRRVQLLSREVVGGEAKEVEVWSGRIYRLALGDGVVVEQVKIPVGVEVGSSELVVRVEHGDSPPLRIRGFGLTRWPVLLGFHAASAGVYRAYLGHRLVESPRYDLDALSSRLGVMESVRCEWGEVVSNPLYDGSVGLPVQGVWAGAIDLADWTYRRGVMVSDPSAVQELELDLWVLARSRQGLEDVRLVSGGRQVPYILERGGILRSFDLRVELERDSDRPRVSRWRLEMPDEGIPVTRIGCEVGTPFFDRAWKLYEEYEEGAGRPVERLLATGRWVRKPGVADGVFWLSPGDRPRGRVLVLEMDNGDNPELEIRAFRGSIQAPRLYFRAPGRSVLELVCGNRRVQAPVYDLAMLAPQVMAVRRARAVLEGVGEVLDGRVRREVGGRGGALFFWVVVVLVVGGLLALIQRLLPEVEGGDK